MIHAHSLATRPEAEYGPRTDSIGRGRLETRRGVEGDA